MGSNDFLSRSLEYCAAVSIRVLRFEFVLCIPSFYLCAEVVGFPHGRFVRRVNCHQFGRKAQFVGFGAHQFRRFNSKRNQVQLEGMQQRYSDDGIKIEFIFLVFVLQK